MKCKRAAIINPLAAMWLCRKIASPHPERCAFARHAYLLGRRLARGGGGPRMCSAPAACSRVQATSRTFKRPAALHAPPSPPSPPLLLCCLPLSSALAGHQPHLQAPLLPYCCSAHPSQPATPTLCPASALIRARRPPTAPSNAPTALRSAPPRTAKSWCSQTWTEKHGLNRKCCTLTAGGGNAAAASPLVRQPFTLQAHATCHAARFQA